MSPRLGELLAEAKELGFLGPGPIDVGVSHARGFAAGPDAAPPARVVDLGTGGGLPGLVLAELWGEAVVLLVEANERRSRFLGNAVEALGWVGRVRVVAERAEVAGRRDELRSTVDLVVARSFGPAAVTAECGAPFLRVGGRLVVSEPPGPASRWPADPLAELGLALGPAWTTEFHYQSLVQVAACAARYPRRVGVPAKRPLF